MNQKYTKLDGTVSIYKVKNRKWIKSSRRYKPQKRGPEKPSIYSKHFGLLDLYNRKEQQTLKCPSGYTIGQCFNILHKMWYAYHKSRDSDEDIEKMKKYAKAIQDVQEDLGIKTTSFPHLALYGDVLVLNNTEENSLVFTNHSALKKKQEAYEKWQVENSKKIQEALQKPDKEKGESILVIADDVYPYEMVDNEETVPHLLEPDEEKGEQEIIITDDTPFQNNQNSNHTKNAKKIQEQLQKPDKEKGKSILVIADDVYPYEMVDNEETVPDLLEPDEEKGEQEIIISDDTPFQNQNRKGSKM